MESQWKTRLRAAAVLTFEDMCLLVPETIEDGQLPSKNLWTAHVRFSGPYDGGVYVAVDGGFLPELVSNITGEEKSEDQTLLLDGLGEIGNIIAGNFLPTIEGEEAVFVLAAPEVTKVTSNDNANSPSETLILSFEDGNVAVWTTVD